MDTALLKKEILFRATRRGVKELDITLGRFAAAQVEQLSAAELAEFRDLLLHTDLDLLDWLTGATPPPAAVNTPLFARLKASQSQGTL